MASAELEVSGPIARLKAAIRSDKNLASAPNLRAGCRLRIQLPKYAAPEFQGMTIPSA